MSELAHNAESVCPNRPGRGHEWYMRASDRLQFCRDCGYGWTDETDTVGRSLGRRRPEQFDGSVRGGAG